MPNSVGQLKLIGFKLKRTIGYVHIMSELRWIWPDWISQLVEELVEDIVIEEEKLFIS